MALEFVDDRKKVTKGADGGQNWGVGIASEPSCRSERECGADEIERDETAVQLDC
jgi:hypothetical protein